MSKGSFKDIRSWIYEGSNLFQKVQWSKQRSSKMNHSQSVFSTFFLLSGLLVLDSLLTLTLTEVYIIIVSWSYLTLFDNIILTFLVIRIFLPWSWQSSVKSFNINKYIAVRTALLSLPYQQWFAGSPILAWQKRALMVWHRNSCSWCQTKEMCYDQSQHYWVNLQYEPEEYQVALWFY